MSQCEANTALATDLNQYLTPPNGQINQGKAGAQHPITSSSPPTRYQIQMPPRPQLPQITQINCVSRSGGGPHPSQLGGQFGRGHGDIRMKKFTC